MNPPRDASRPFLYALQPAFGLYIQHVSPRSMAIPIETAAFLWWLCDATEAKAVADLGSGFTSYVLRLFAAQAADPVVVHSVDDDPYWLQRSVQFCEYHSISVDGFMLDHDWLESEQTYDVIVHDLAGGDKRNEFAGHAARKLNPGGHLVFDDAQNHGHHHAFSEVCRSEGLTMLDIWSQTIEDAGRYAAMGVRP